jgi:hypothetical protein
MVEPMSGKVPRVSGLGIQSTSRALMVCMVALAVAAHPAAAAPVTTTDVEKLIKRGNELRSAGKDQEALPLYQKAYEISQTPRTAAQLGLCEFALGYWLAADGHLSESLASRGEWIDRNRGTIEGSVREVRKHLGEVIVTGSPVGAAVSINGRNVGALPLGPVRVLAGQVRVDVTAPGHKDHSQTVVVVGDTQERVAVDLRREGESVGVSGQPASDPSRPRQPAADEGPSWGGRKIAGAVLVGVGIAAIATGAFSLRGANEDCNAPQGAVCNKGARSKVPGWTLIGGGAALGIVGGVVFVSGGDAEGSSRHAVVFTIRGSF